MNDKALRTYGLESREQIKGKKCYEILRNNCVRCVNCINDGRYSIDGRLAEAIKVK